MPGQKITVCCYELELYEEKEPGNAMHIHKAMRAFGNDTHVQWERADVVIVGNGIAGLTAALEARRLAPEKRIAIITEQCHPTINTPALKQFAIGKLAQEQLLAYPAGTEHTQQIEVINTRVDEIQAREKCLCLSGGERFGYDTLLLATGSKPNGLQPSVPGYNFDGVCTLHQLSDYLDLRRRLRLREVQTAIVIGGGLHAMETVMGLVHEGVNVHWLIRGSTFLPSMLDHAASEIVLEYSRRAGVQVSTNTEVTGIIGRIGVVAGVVTNHQQTLTCQLVLLCTGTTPVVSLAEHCDMTLKQQNGILVDEHLRTSVRNVYAAGDAVALWNPQARAYQRQSFWHAAVLQGRVAAASMVGYQNEVAPFGVPWHATQLGELSLLTVGSPLHGSLEETTVTDKKRGSYCLLTIRNNQLVGYLSLGKTQPDGLAIKRIIDEGLPIQNIERSLITGEFDARQYFARQHTHAALHAHNMAVTGKFVVSDTSLPRFNPSQQSNPTQDTEPLLLTPILGELHELHALADDEDSLQKRVERRASLNTSIKSFKSKIVEAREWIIPTILPEGLIVLAGKQEIGKSLLGLTIGLSVASGETVIGNSNVEQGHVLYLALEESERRLQERISQLLIRGASLHDDFEYVTSWPRLDGDGLVEIESWLDSRSQPRLVIIDSWTTSLPGMEQQAGEIAYDAEYETFEKLRELAHIYHVSIMVHFHIDTATSDAYFDKLIARSSTGACADGILHLKRSHGSRDAILSGTGRAYAQGLQLALSFNDGYWELLKHEPMVMRTRDSLSQARRAIIEVLHQHDRPMKAGEIAMALGKRDQTIRKMLLEMKASRLIQATDQGYVALIPQKEFSYIGTDVGV